MSVSCVFAFAESDPQAFGGVGATSIDGLRSKKPTGLSQKLTVSTGMIGQSSGRVMWWSALVWACWRA